MNREQLEQKKAQLDKEYQFQVKVADRFQDLLDEETKYNAFLSQGKGIVAIKIENIEDAGRILTSFEPTHDSIEFRFAGKHPQYFGYPYKIDIKNEVRMPSYLRISFQSEGMEL
jgi:hypothetical protein